MASANNSPHLRLLSRRRRDDLCDDYFYYDKAISSCTPCDHLCDDHEYQGTTDQCIQKCYKYYMRMQAADTHPTTPGNVDTTMGNNSFNNPGTFQGDMGTAILTVVAVILIVACFGLVYVIFWKCRKRRIPNRQNEEVKRSVPCSEEDGIDNLAESQKRLIPSMGPICQPQENPQEDMCQGATSRQAVDSLHRTFAELGVPFSVLDEPLLSHETIPKDTYSDTNSASYVIGSSPSTTPKVVYDSVSGTGDLHSVGTGTETGTIAEHSTDTELYG